MVARTLRRHFICQIFIKIHRGRASLNQGKKTDMKFEFTNLIKSTALTLTAAATLFAQSAFAQLPYEYARRKKNTATPVIAT